MPGAGRVTLERLAIRLPTRSIFLSELPRPTPARRWGIGVRRERATGSSAAPNDLIICKRSRPVLVLHERKTPITLMTRLAGKTAGETIAAMMAILRRRSPLSSDQWRKMARPRMRGSITFDNDTCFARHALLRGMLSATTYFCDA
jgi:hypothetical protein